MYIVNHPYFILVVQTCGWQQILWNYSQQHLESQETYRAVRGGTVALVVVHVVVCV